jgi:hypothetical protein
LLLFAEYVFAAAAPVAAQDPPEPSEQVVLFAVALVGFTPGVDAVFCDALPVAEVVAVVCVAAAAAPFFSCPGALAELPGAVCAVAVAAVSAPLPLPLPLLPFPFPAKAEPTKIVSAIDSTSVLRAAVKRLLISFSPRIRMTMYCKGRYALQTILL